MNDILLEIVPLSCYVVFIFYAFCDGFHLRPARKLLWAIYFLTFSYLSFWSSGKFDLKIIIPLCSTLAMVLAWFQKRDNQSKGN